MFVKILIPGNDDTVLLAANNPAMLTLSIDKSRRPKLSSHFTF
jgi:hypothetical protein